MALLVQADSRRPHEMTAPRLLLSSSTPVGRSSLASTSRLTLQQHVRHSHVGSAPLWLPPGTSLTLQPFPPQKDPLRPLAHSMSKAQSVLVKGPLGQLLVPIYSGVHLEKAEAVKSEATTSNEEAELQQRYNVVIREKNSLTPKKLRGFWGLVNSLLRNALAGVSEGHSTYLRLVGVGYRAALEADPSPPLSKLQQAVQPGARTYWHSKEQEEVYLNQFATPPQHKAQRLVIRLGYSHPVHVSIPPGITASVPQPTRIVLKGVDKEAVKQLAAKIRAWRPPEPYKVRLHRDLATIFSPLLTQHHRTSSLNHRVKASLSKTRQSSSRQSRRSKPRVCVCDFENVLLYIACSITVAVCHCLLPHLGVLPLPTAMALAPPAALGLALSD